MAVRARIRTRGHWVIGVNATSVLCGPLSSKNFIYFLLKRVFRDLPRGQKRSRFRRSARFRLDFRRNWQKFPDSEAVLFCWQIKVLLSSISETTNSISGLRDNFLNSSFVDATVKQKNSRAWKAFFSKARTFCFFSNGFSSLHRPDPLIDQSGRLKKVKWHFDLDPIL